MTLIVHLHMIHFIVLHNQVAKAKAMLIIIFLGYYV